MDEKAIARRLMVAWQANNWDAVTDVADELWREGCRREYAAAPAMAEVTEYGVGEPIEERRVKEAHERW